MRRISITTATGPHEPMEIPPALEGKSAMECIALVTAGIVEERREQGLPDGFNAPVTIVLEEA